MSGSRRCSSSQVNLFAPIEPVVPQKLRKRAARLSPVELEEALQTHATREFKQLVKSTRPKRSAFRAGSAYPSMCKNRYSDVLANDETRILLSDGTYINGNHINFPLPSGEDHYIACQAPLPSTIKDFYMMVAEQRSACIVMLTDLLEGNRQKADRYWPTEEEPELRVSDEMCVTFKSSSNPAEGLRVTVLQLRLGAEDAPARQVYHLHYTKWKDQSTPEEASSMPTLVMYARLFCEKGADEQGLDGPMVCHCSAGIGRTGTFIALSFSLRLCSLGDRPDIFTICQQMREKRSGMVQTKQQYLFIYTCVNEYIRAHTSKGTPAPLMSPKGTFQRRASSMSLLTRAPTRPRSKSVDE